MSASFQDELRDKFAAEAMAALLVAASNEFTSDTAYYDADMLATAAYKMADAMLVARDET